MLDKLKTWAAALSGETQTTEDPVPGASELAMATALLLVEAANLDGDFDADEEQTIRTLLVDRLDVPDNEADDLVESARQRHDGHVSLHSLAMTVKTHLSPEDRVSVMEMLWEVVYADGVVHDYEANLARRVAGLLHIHDRDAGAARKRVLARLEEK